MTAHRRGSSFIRYELPVELEEKPAHGKPKPKPITSMAVGEESGTHGPKKAVTTMGLAEEGGKHGR
ncbi:hypothetical protein [Hyalangium gracile]|uniref:hypothetical protein n=1 Tax=Hyalangium gracile TaxID=394092 RepID=UPI001CCFE268|nr:hypothetical protein [Hyalangium gracile]